MDSSHCSPYFWEKNEGTSPVCENVLVFQERLPQEGLGGPTHCNLRDIANLDDFYCNPSQIIKRETFYIIYRIFQEFQITPPTCCLCFYIFFMEGTRLQQKHKSEENIDVI